MSRRGTALAAMLLGSSLVLGGCGSDEDRAANAIEEAAQDAGEDVEVDVDGDDITIEKSDGTVSMGGDLPEGFPEDDIPLVDGDVQLAMGAAEQGWQVSIYVAAVADEAVADAVALLTRAGFTLGDETDMGDVGSATLSSDAYVVYLTGTTAGAQTTLLYSIEVK